MLLILCSKSKNERTVTLKRYFKFTADLFEHTVAENVELSLIGPGLRVETGVNDGAISLRRAFSHVATGLKYGERNIPAGKFARNSASDNTRSYDDNIIFRHNVSISNSDTLFKAKKNPYCAKGCLQPSPRQENSSSGLPFRPVT